jgi:hypothetical protein
LPHGRRSLGNENGDRYVLDPVHRLGFANLGQA